eukprot:1157814-Pelagomonas_calceolata.AAC.4
MPTTIPFPQKDTHLEHQEIADFDTDAEGAQALAVGVPAHGPVIDLVHGLVGGVAGAAAGLDVAREGHLLALCVSRKARQKCMSTTGVRHHGEDAWRLCQCTLGRIYIYLFIYACKKNNFQPCATHGRCTSMVVDMQEVAHI